MADSHDFCRLLLSEVMKDVRKYVPKVDYSSRKVWGYKYEGTDSLEFHGPHNFFWTGSGCCVYQARIQGWDSYLRHIKAEGYWTEEDEEMMRPYVAAKKDRELQVDLALRLGATLVKKRAEVDLTDEDRLVWLGSTLLHFQDVLARGTWDRMLKDLKL
jgi:hypothetical protein